MVTPHRRQIEAEDKRFDAAASIVKARDSKPVDSVFDLTLVLADVAEKALVRRKPQIGDTLPAPSSSEDDRAPSGRGNRSATCLAASRMVR